MWTVSGPFDIDLENATGPITTKLLRPGKEYATGRKAPAALVLKSKKVSAKHCEFVVQKFTSDHVVDPTARPILRFSTMAKVITLQRAGETIPINPESSIELRNGDILDIARNKITVNWEPVCCYKDPAAKSKLLKACAGLGIHLVHTSHSEITHHITDTFEPTLSQAHSLLQSAKFVTQDWLDEVLRLGELPIDSDPSNDVSLEQSFKLPSPAKYRPEFSPELSAKHKELATWEPNEARMKMFSKYRFILMAEGSRNVNSELRNLISLGEGHPEVYDITGPSEKLNKVFARGKAKTNQDAVLVADAEACQVAIGKSNWNEIVKLTEAFQLHILSPQDVLMSVLNADTSILDSPSASARPDRAPSSSPLPDFVPNTHEEEDSIVPDEEKEPEPKPVKRLTRRTASRQASQEPEAAPPAPAPKRHLTRRAQPTGQPIITGLDDASVILNNLPDTSMPPPATTPIEPKPRSKLKRRVGVPETTVSESTSIFATVERDTGEEPPTKKFKALFDASHPARSGVDSFVQQSGAFNEEELMTIGGMSQTQTETQGETQGGRSGGRRVGIGGSGALGAVPEEEEEASQMPGIEDGPTVGQKRKERSDDIEMADAATSDTGPAAKKRATVGNGVERAGAGTLKPPSTTAKPTAAAKTLPTTKSTAAAAKKGATAGAPTGKPDTDSAFLKAIASTKRGKKTEDDFDRDFNKLKISKSNLRAADEDEARPEWELLEDFGDESNLRGNFMVIHEIEVFKVYGGAERRRASDPRWEGKPDFKKFKRTTSLNSQKKAVELFINDENDGGIGPGYWKTGDSQNPDDDFDVKPKKKKAATQPAASRSKGQATTQSTQAMIIDDSSDEEPVKRKAAKRGTSTKPPSKAAEPAKKRTTRASSKTPVSLFLDDSDADVIPEEDATMDEGFTSQTLQSSAETTAPPRRSARPTRKAAAAPIIVDDDEDEVFGTRRS